MNCACCDCEFEPRSSAQITCGARACKLRRAYLIRRESAAYVARSRLTNRRWAEENRGVRGSRPWLLGAPPHDPLLPGAVLHVDLALSWARPLALADLRGVHGIVTKQVGREHHSHVPDFSLIESTSPLGWSVYLRDLAVARELSGRRVSTHFFGQPAEVTFGEVLRVEAPVVRERGKQLVRLQTTTPVVIRTNRGSGETRREPTADSLRSTLSDSLAARVGARTPKEQVLVEVVDDRTAPASIVVGGKLGRVDGWAGTVDVQVNAVALWLLRCAEVVGLGGRTAFGFGRIIVRE